jgi:hypothetical protein
MRRSAARCVSASSPTAFETLPNVIASDTIASVRNPVRGMRSDADYQNSRTAAISVIRDHRERRVLPNSLLTQIRPVSRDKLAGQREPRQIPCAVSARARSNRNALPGPAGSLWPAVEGRMHCHSFSMTGIGDHAQFQERRRRSGPASPARRTCFAVQNFWPKKVAAGSGRASPTKPGPGGGARAIRRAAAGLGA